MRVRQSGREVYNRLRSSCFLSRYATISECFSFRESSAQEGHSLGELLRTLVVDEIYVSEQTKATDAELQQYFQTFFEYLCVCLDSPPERGFLLIRREARRLLPC
jgi:hypothetical protein